MTTLEYLFKNFQKDNVLDLSKPFEDNRINVIEELQFVSGRFPAFSCFPTMFSKAILLRIVKVIDCMVFNTVFNIISVVL